MGLFSSLFESTYIAKCVVQVKEVLPDSGDYALAFCEANRWNLLDMRAQHSATEAVNYLCLLILDSPKTMFDRHGDDAHKWFTIASNYVLAYMSRWPDSPFNRMFNEGLQNFIKWTKETNALGTV